jgi:phosphoribosylformylglycinamidine synthase
LFGEAQSRVVVSLDASNESAFEEMLSVHGVPFERLGKVTSGAVDIDGQNWGNVEDWKELYDNAIGQYLAGESAESALTAV